MKNMKLLGLLFVVLFVFGCQNEDVYISGSEVVCSTGAILVDGYECIAEPQLQEEKPPRYVSLVGSLDRVISDHTSMEEFSFISDDGGEVLNSITLQFQRTYWLDESIEDVNIWVTNSPHWKSGELTARIYPELDHCISGDGYDACIWKDIEVELNHTIHKGVNSFYVWMDTSNFQSKDVLDFKLIQYKVDNVDNGCNPYYGDSRYGIPCLYRQVTLY